MDIGSFSGGEGDEDNEDESSIASVDEEELDSNQEQLNAKHEEVKMENNKDHEVKEVKKEWVFSLIF